MATFETQVEALTGIALDGSSNPTQTELTSFLIDGVKDVVNKIVKINPTELSKFTNTTNSTSHVDKIGTILSVMREHDSVTILRKCTQIDPSDRYDATDSDSLNFKSKSNPGYYELDGAVYVVPAAGGSNNDIIVTQVHYDTGIVFGDTYGASNSSIENFPTDYEHLVAIYAAIKSLQNNLVKTTISSLSITTVPPDTPSAPSFSYVNAADDTSINSAIGTISTLSGIGSVPTYTHPKVGGETEELTATITNDADADANKLDFSDWFEKVGDFIQNDEDVELAGSQLQKINSYVSAYNAAMTNQLNTFNEKNTAYQAEIKELLQESQIEATRLTTIYNKVSDINLQNALRTYQTQVDEYSQRLSRYSGEVSGYTADVGKEVQEFTQNLQVQITNYQWKQGQLVLLQQEYLLSTTAGASE